MATSVSGTIKLDGQPLKRTFVEVLASLRLFGSSVIYYGIDFFLTDDNGHFSALFDPPSFPWSFNVSNFALRLHCHNATIRVLKAATPDKKIRVVKTMGNGNTLDLTQNDLGHYYDHFRILGKCLDVYETVWRQFPPYGSDFPLGCESTMAATFADSDFVSLAYPAGSPPPLAYVEPSDPTHSQFPLVHIRDNDNRLFGTSGSSTQSPTCPTLLPHELGHAFHFSALSGDRRATIGNNYVDWIFSHLLDFNWYHGENRQTTPFIAFIEAMGIFSERFYFFSKLVQPTLTGAALRSAFVQDELTIHSLATPANLGYQYINVGTLSSLGQLSTDALKGKDVEGAVYGAVYLHLSRLISLEKAIWLVITSQATTFDELKAYAMALPAGNAGIIVAINTVEQTWFP